jgi:hypothetical protein
MIKLKLPNIPFPKQYSGFFQFIFATLFVVFMPIFLLLMISGFARKIVYKLSGGNYYNNPDLMDTMNAFCYDSPFYAVTALISFLFHLVFLVVTSVNFVITSSEMRYFTINYTNGTPISISVRDPYCVEVSNKKGFDYISTIMKDSYMFAFNYGDRCDKSPYITEITSVYNKPVMQYKPQELVTILRSQEFINSVYVTKEQQPELQP